jgi:hypothetical protein
VQVPPVQAPAPFETGAGQAVQRVPHVAAAVSDEQMPLQLWVPVGHVPLHARLAAMQAPAQSCWPDGHVEPHERPSQVALPPVGTGHAVHDVVPQLEVRALLTQAPVPAGQRWKPFLHMMPHAPFEQTAVPLASVGHFVHDAPQALASLSAEQPVPHLW